MHTTITHAAQFRDAFRSVGRAEQFSYEALGLLFDYFEDNAPDMELDCIAICCDYAEESVDEIMESYDIYLAKCCDDIHERKEIVLDYLEKNTQVIGETSSSIVYCSSF